MKIGVIGPRTTVRVIEDVVKKQLFDIQLVCRISEFYEATPRIVKELQQMPEVEAILFTGPTNYGHAKNHVQPTIPWGYLPHNRSSLQESFLKAITMFNNDLKAISVDRYDTNLLEEVLSDIGVTDFSIIGADGDYEQEKFEKNLFEFHKKNYLDGNATICLTSMEHILEPLIEAGIPCIRIYPSKESVTEQIYHLRMMSLSRSANKGLFATIVVNFDYIFDDEEDIFAREWEKMKYQNEFREMIYTIARQLDGAVFADGLDRFYITTNRNMLLNVFLKTSMHHNLLAFGRRSHRQKIWIGMGIGTTMLEAKSRATMAYNCSKADTVGSSYLADDAQITKALNIDSSHIEKSSETDLLYLSKKLHISSETLLKLANTLETIGDIITSESLSFHMGLTTRSINRLVLCLEDEGLATVVGKKSLGKGRPARLLKITLPKLNKE